MTTPSTLLAIDQGTTGTRAILFDGRFRTLAAAYLEHRQHFPKPGWVEHDPEEIWSNTLAVTRQALKKAGLRPQRVSAVGITNQRETTLVWERAGGRALHPAIVWQCRRSQAVCDRLREAGLAERFLKATGLVLDPYFSGTKLTWLAEHKPAVAKALSSGRACAGTVDSFLLWRMTGGAVHATDYTNASRTLLFNIKTRQWDADLCRLLKVPLGCLPEARPSAGSFGRCDPRAFAGISAPVTGIAGDQQAALYGQGCWEAGDAKNTYGTGCFLLVHLGGRARISRKGLLTTLCCDAKGQPAYALEGSVFIGGAVIQWLRDGLKFFGKAGESEALAGQVQDTGGVVIVPAFVGLGAPDWDSRARGAVFGLTRGTGRAHIARAALEAVALQSAGLIRLAEAEAGLKLPSLRVDGGATANHLLMQMQADTLGKVVERAAEKECTALGAAALAGVGAGLFSPASIKASLGAGRTRFKPRASAAWREASLAAYRKAVEAVKQFAR